MTQAEAWGAFALLCCVGAIVFGAVRFHRARASLRDASQARMNQWVAEMAAQAATANAQPAEETVEGENAGTGENLSKPAGEPEQAPADEPVDEPVDEPAQESADEPVAEPRPVDVRSEMDAFFGNGLPPTGR